MTRTQKVQSVLSVLLVCLAICVLRIDLCLAADDPLTIDKDGKVQINTNLDVKGPVKANDTMEVSGSLKTKELNVSNTMIVKGRLLEMGAMETLLPRTPINTQGWIYDSSQQKERGSAISDGFVSVVAEITSNMQAFWVYGIMVMNGNEVIVASASCNAVTNQDYPIHTNSFMIPVKKGQAWKVKYGYYNIGSALENTAQIAIYWTPLTTGQN